ncbi:phosphate/phosphite/phosphonate ABC transporter substrate-binding protein [Kaarinaea lacus]
MARAGLKELLVTSFALLLSATQVFADVRSNSAELVFGVLPQGMNNTIEAQWKLLIEQVSVESGHKIRFEAAENLEDFERKLSRGAYDFVLLNAHMYTQAHEAIGYQAFAKEAGHTDKGVIVVHRDSPVKTLADLKSQTLALSDPRRFTSTVLTRAYLNNEGIEVNEEYVESDNSVYRAVLDGDSVAGAGEINTLNSINPNAHSKLRVLWSSKQYSSNAFAAHPRVKPEQLEHVQQALMSLNYDAKGKRLLSKVKFKGIDKAADQEWDDIRALKEQLAN